MPEDQLKFESYCSAQTVTCDGLLRIGASPSWIWTCDTIREARKALRETFKDFEMATPGTPSLDQLKVFLAVVEAGSFAAAGRQLGRATSAVSYSIANLELQLGVPLFDREQTRKPTLTEAGKAVLSEARTLSTGVDNLRAKVKRLLEGLEAELTLVVDVNLPTARLVDAMQAFEARFPTVALRLHVERLGGVTRLVHAGVADIGISGPLQLAVQGIERIRIADVELIAVAAPSHPLATSRTISPGVARNHLQLVSSDRSEFAEGQQGFGVVGLKSWQVNDLGTRRALLLAGVGWAYMPAPMVRDELATSRLKRLKLSDWPGGIYALHIIHRTDTPPKPAAAWLIECFAGQSA
jgi:DNA-binding transcriptional LysR family regulator